MVDGTSRARAVTLPRMWRACRRANTDPAANTAAIERTASMKRVLSSSAAFY